MSSKPFEDVVTLRVCGIPARVKVMIFPGYVGGRDSRGIKDEPDFETEVEIMEVQDTKGRRARWLESKLDAMGKKGWNDLQTAVEETLKKRKVDRTPD